MEQKGLEMSENPYDTKSVHHTLYVSFSQALFQVLVTGLGAGTLFTPLVFHKFGWLYGSFCFMSAALLTLLAQIQILHLCNRHGGDVFEVITADSGVLGKEITKLFMILLNISIAGIALQYIVGNIGHVFVYWGLGKAELVRRPTILLTMALVLPIVVKTPRSILSRIAPLMPIFNISCVLLTLPLIVVNASLLPDLMDRIMDSARGQFPIDVPLGIGMSLQMMSNYTPIPKLASSMDPRRRESRILLFYFPMMFCIVPTFVLMAFSGTLLLGDRLVADVLSSSPLSWWLFSLMRIIFGCNRFLTVILAIDNVIGVLTMKGSRTFKLFPVKFMLCVMAGTVSLVFGSRMRLFIEWNGIVLVGAVYMIMPSMTSYRPGNVLMPTIIILCLTFLFLAALNTIFRFV